MTARNRVRRGVLLAALLVAGATAGLLVAATVPPTYTASATSVVSTGRAPRGAAQQQGASAALQAGRSYAALATSSRVLHGVIEDLHLSTTPEALAPRVSAQTAQDTLLLRIDVTDRSALQAARVANGVQHRLADTVASLAPVVRRGTALTAVQRAVPPDAPSSPDTLLAGAVGALAGAAAWWLIGAARRGPRASGGLAAPSML